MFCSYSSHDGSLMAFQSYPHFVTSLMTFWYWKSILVTLHPSVVGDAQALVLNDIIWLARYDPASCLMAPRRPQEIDWSWYSDDYPAVFGCRLLYLLISRRVQSWGQDTTFEEDHGLCFDKRPESINRRSFSTVLSRLIVRTVESMDVG